MKKKIGLGELQNGVYVIKIPAAGSSLVVVDKDITSLWHARLGHPSNHSLQCISSFLNCKFDFNKLPFCDVCHKSKQCRLSFNHSTNKFEESFSLIHCDLWGNIILLLIMTHIFFLTIVDDYTRGTWVYLMRDKSKTCGIVMNFHNMIKTQFNKKIKRVRSDNGTEFVNSLLETSFIKRV